MADALNRADVGPPDRELTAIQKREVSHRRSGGADTPILSVHWADRASANVHK